MEAFTPACFQSFILCLDMLSCRNGPSQQGGTVPLVGSYTGKASCVAKLDTFSFLRLFASCRVLRFIFVNGTVLSPVPLVSFRGFFFL